MTPLLLSRKDAASALSLSLSTIAMLIGTGQLRVRRHGRRVLIPVSEVERFAKRDVAHLWPAKVNGKTTRHAAL